MAAPSDRSSCKHCKQKIAKGNLRFEVVATKSRPPCYVHADCVVPFHEARRELVEPSLVFLCESELPEALRVHQMTAKASLEMLRVPSD